MDPTYVIENEAELPIDFALINIWGTASGKKLQVLFFHMLNIAMCSIVKQITKK